MGDERIDELIARERIRELVATYSHLGDRGQLDAMVDLFEPDAELDGFGERFVGHDEIRRFFLGITNDRAEATRRTFVRHHISNVSITIESDEGASGVSYWAVYSDDGFESSGRYRDTYRRRADGWWRFRTRKIRRDTPSP